MFHSDKIGSVDKMIDELIQVRFPFVGDKGG